MSKCNYLFRLALDLMICNESRMSSSENWLKQLRDSESEIVGKPVRPRPAGGDAGF